MLRLAAFVLLFVTLAACGGGEAEMSPEQAAVFSEGVDAELVVRAVPNAMRFEDVRIEAPAGARVRLVMDNTETSSPAMVHNIVVLRDEAAIMRVGMAAAGSTDSVPDDPGIIVTTPFARPRAKVAVVFTMPPAGEYPYICTYPGHFQSMQGVLVSTPS